MNVEAVVLAGGFGTRLRPLTWDTPKPLVPVLGRPLLEWVIRTLPDDVIQVTLAAGFRSEKLEKYARTNPLPKNIEIEVEPYPLDTAGAIKYATRHSTADTYIVYNGDIISSLDVRDMLEFHEKHDGIATIALYPVPEEEVHRFGVVDIDDDNKIHAFVEKPDPQEAPSNLINAGTYILDREVIERIPEGRPVSIEREIFPELAEEGLLYGYTFEGYWVDVGLPESYLEAHRILMEHECNDVNTVGARVKATETTPPVVVMQMAEIENSHLGPYVYVAERAHIDGCTVENSVIHRDATLESSEIKNSIIGPRTHVRNAELEAVVTGRDTEITDCTLKDVKISPGKDVRENLEDEWVI